MVGFFFEKKLCKETANKGNGSGTSTKRWGKQVSLRFPGAYHPWGGYNHVLMYVTLGGTHGNFWTTKMADSQKVDDIRHDDQNSIEVEIVSDLEFNMLDNAIQAAILQG